VGVCSLFKSRGSRYLSCRRSTVCRVRYSTSIFLGDHSCPLQFSSVKSLMSPLVGTVVSFLAAAEGFAARPFSVDAPPRPFTSLSFFTELQSDGIFGTFSGRSCGGVHLKRTGPARPFSQRVVSQRCLFYVGLSEQ